MLRRIIGVTGISLWAVLIAVVVVWGFRASANSEQMFENLPEGWKVERSFGVSKAQTAAISRKLGSRISKLTNTVLGIEGKQLQVNVFHCPTPNSADKIYKAVLEAHSGLTGHVARDGNLVIEFAKSDDINLMNQVRRALGLEAVKLDGVARKLIKKIPAGWRIENSFIVPRDQTVAIAKKLGGRIKNLSNTIFSVDGKRFQVNVIECVTSTGAEKIHKGVLKMKEDPAFCIKLNNSVVEFVGDDVELAKKAVYELGIKARTGKATIKYQPPSYVRIGSFNEEDFQVGTGQWALPGILSLPKGQGPFPAVVLVHGAGPQDKDESIGSNKPFRDLALGLASRGIAVLRYDKRTKAFPAQMTAIVNKLTIKEETMDDALAAVALLRKNTEIDTNKIFVLGHSLGGFIIPRIGKLDSKIAGFIVMAGAARPLEDVILDQFSYVFSVDGIISETEKSELDKLKRQVAKVKDPKLSPTSPASDLPFGAPAAFWLDLRGYNPAETAKELTCPMLIVQGGRDYQVTNADFRLWRRALSSRKNVKFKWYDKLNHLFIEGEGKSTPAEYQMAGNVARIVIEDIADWIKKL